MKKTFFFSNRLDDSTGLVKVNHNNVMQTVSPTTKTPWFLRIQEAINLRGLARAFGLGLLCGEPNEVTQSAENAPQTAMEQKTPLNRIGLGKKAIIAVLALATMLTTSIEQARAQTSSTNSAPAPYTLQHGDEIAEIKIGGVWKPIWEWIKGLFKGAAGSAIWDSIKAKWNAKPFTPSTGTVVAYAQVKLKDLYSERYWWYGHSGEPISSSTNNLATLGRVLIDRDYQYYDITYRRLYWDSENEIYKHNWGRRSRHRFGHDEFAPDKLNRRYNQGEHGAYYPDHDDYYKGKRGYIITWGMASKHDVIHEFCSDVDEDARDDDLAKAAEKEKLDKFKPKAYAWLSDMRYEKNEDDIVGWTYTGRTSSVMHQKKLSAISDKCKDVKFVPLNTRLDRFRFQNNKSTLFWKKGVTNAQPGDKIKLSSGKKIELQQAVPIPHDVVDREIDTW